MTLPPTEHFESTVLVHLDAAYNLARWLTHNDQDAQDVVQESCLRAWRAFDQFRGAEARPWLLAIVRNTAFTWNKSRRNIADLDEHVDLPIDEQADPQAILLRAADADLVRHAIELLPPDLRTIVVLREMEGFSYKQLATTLAVPIGTVMSRLARARQRLAELLTEPDPAAELS